MFLSNFIYLPKFTSKKIFPPKWKLQQSFHINHPHQFSPEIHNSSICFNNNWISLQFPFLWQTAAYQAITHIFITFFLQQLEANSVALKMANLMQYIHLFFALYKSFFSSFWFFPSESSFPLGNKWIQEQTKAWKSLTILIKKEVNCYAPT